uniref:A kinase (PRKA) anchor protein 9 n=1 Tax=Astyanax mexicanus TaxID=7994 RepID=A0A3B1JLI7_ASTMX
NHLVQTQYASMAAGEDATLESLLQTEREALDRKEKEIVNLEEQLEQFREELQNKSEEVQQLHMQLEIQRKEISTQQQELLTQTNLHTVLQQKDRDIALLNEHIAKLQLTEPPEDEDDRHGEEEYDELKQKLEAVVKELETLKTEHSSLLVEYEGVQQELSHIEQKEDHHGEEEYDELKQKLDAVVKELDFFKTDHLSLLVKYESLQQELSHVEHKQTSKIEDDELKQKLDAVVKELETLKTDHSSLLVKYESLQQELSHVEHKQQQEDNLHGEEAYDELKQKLDAVIQELDTLKTDHSSLLDKYEKLQQELSNVERKQSPEDKDDLHGEEEYDELKQKLDAVVKELETLKTDHSSLLGEDDLHGKEEYDELKQKMDMVVKELDSLKTDHSTLLVKYESLQQELSNVERTQSPKIEGDLHGEEEYNELKQKMDAVIQELDTLKTDHSSLLIKYEGVQQELSNVERTQSPKFEHDLHGKEEYNELKQKMDAVIKELETLKTDHSSLIVKYEGVKQELSNVEQKEDLHGEEEYDELNQKLDAVVKELETLKTDHSSLLVKYESLQQEALDRDAALDEALRDRTAALVVAQAQVHALQESRIAELEESVEEKEAELHACRLQVEKAQDGAEMLHLKVSQLEEKLREKVAAVLVSQAQLEAVQVQTKELHREEATLDQAIAGLLDSRADLEGEGHAVARVQKARTPGKVGLLSEKLQELEQGLSFLQKDQELQKELLSSSEEEVQEYERRLAVLMELLNQMRTKPSPTCAQVRRRTTPHNTAQHQTLVFSSNNNNNCLLLVLQVLSDGDGQVEEVLAELQKVRDEANAANEELTSCRELSRNLQEQIQEREMTIALLKDQLHRVESSELLQELQEVRTEAAATKEELNSYIEQNLKLQEQIQSSSQSRKKAGKHSDGKSKSSSVAKDKPALSRKNSSSQSSNGSQHLPNGRVDAGTQVERVEASEELEEVIGEYTERIGQMQELHAARDHGHGEPTHFRERQSERGRTSVWSRSAPPSEPPSATCAPMRLDQLSVHSLSVRVCGVDSSSDWSQRTGFEFRSTPEGARREESDPLPDRIKTLLREVHQEGMQVLSLSELPVPEAELPCITAPPAGLEERAGSSAGHGGVPQNPHYPTADLHPQPDQASTDWRGDLLGAVQQVFLRERQVLKVTLLTNLDLLDPRDAVNHLNQIQRLLTQQVCVKASEVESLSDRLAEEQKRARELQWVMEREKNRAERREEGEREEVEVQLDAQRLQVVELSSALQKEKELNSELLKQLKHSSSDLQRPPQAVSAQGVQQVEEGVRSMETLLQSLQDQLTEKQSALVDLMGQLEQQKLQDVQAKRAWEEERGDLSRDLQGATERLEKLERRVQEVQALLDGERERGTRLERERDGLQRRLTDLMDRGQRDSVSFRNDFIGGGQTVDRTRDWVLQQKTEDLRTLTSSSTTVLDASGQTAGQTAVPNNLDSVVSRLQLIANKINSMTSTSADRLPGDGPDQESLSWLHSNVQDVLSLLQQVPSAPPAVPESAALLTGGSSSALTERLLRQNAELTGFVSRLTEEKNELRNQLLRLEEELRRQRHLSSSRSGSEGQELVLFSGEREAWSRERTRLEKSLRQAESELSRLQGELHNTALKRMYGKYLRAESFRKGFQECEEATLSLIARMGGRPSYVPLDSLGQRRRAFSRFRSAVRVSIALSRSVLESTLYTYRSHCLHKPGRNDSPYLQPGVEQYGERRGTNRTGRDSPRTGHCTHHRYGAGGGEVGGGVLCSHLQNYDPDRALTDYITRLEALQRRLGSVQSGSSSYAQLHFGIRR